MLSKISGLASEAIVVGVLARVGVNECGEMSTGKDVMRIFIAEGVGGTSTWTRDTFDAFRVTSRCVPAVANEADRECISFRQREHLNDGDTQSTDGR